MNSTLIQNVGLALKLYDCSATGIHFVKTDLIFCCAFIFLFILLHCNIMRLELQYSQNSANTSEMTPFTLLVTLKFKTEESLDKFHVS